MKGLNLLPKDILMSLSIELNLHDIINWCSINKRVNKLTCQNDIFWMNKFYHDYGQYSKVKFLTWKEFYKYITVTESNDLLWAGVENILSCVVVALKRGANIDNARKIDYIYRTPLIKASQNGYLEVVKYLVEQGANVSTNNDYSLRMASRYGHLEVVKYLVDQGANVHARNDDALRWASRYGHLKIVKCLVEQGASIYNEHDLILAIINEHLEVVKYLVEQGTNIHAQNDRALRFARKNGHLEIINYLESLP